MDADAQGKSASLKSLMAGVVAGVAAKTQNFVDEVAGKAEDIAAKREAQAKAELGTDNMESQNEGMQAGE